MPTAVSESASAQPAGQEKPDWRTPGKPRRFSWQLLRNCNFRYYFFGSLASNLGTWLQNTVQVLLAYQLTHSVFTVGLVVSAQFVGMVVLSPWAAVLADRIGVKATMVGTQCTSALIAGLMAWRYHQGLLDEHTLIVGALGLGLAFSLALPVQTALVPTLVDLPDTEAAMAMNSVSYNAGRALAPALCVLVLAFIGPTWIFGLNAMSFALFAFVLARLKLDVRNASDDLSAGGVKPRRAHVTDGFKAARRYRRILLLLAVVAAVTFVDDPITVLSPGLVRTTLHVSSNWVGYFIAALGWGTVIGSLSPTMRRKAVDRSRMSQWAACWLLVLAISVVVFTLGISAPVSLAAAFVAGVAALFTGAAAQALIVGDHPNNAASVAALWAIAWAGTKPFASLLDGGLASHFGFLRTAAILAGPAVLLALGELMLPHRAKVYIKKWSLSDHLAFLLPFLRTAIVLVCSAVLLALGELVFPNKARQYIKDWWLSGHPGTRRLPRVGRFRSQPAPGTSR